MDTAHRHRMHVRWSTEDGAYVGSCPPIISECCHGDTEAEVMDQLAVIVEEWLAAPQPGTARNLN
jgi:predicted RNase H-like HicB family nuclease